MDQRRRARPRRARQRHRRSRVRALPLGAEGRAHRREPRARGPPPAARRTPRGAGAGRPRRPVLLQDLRLRPGLPAPARRRPGVRLEARLWHHRPDLAGRLHHPRGLSPAHHGGLRGGAEASEPAARPLLRGHAPEGSEALAHGGGVGRRERYRGAHLHVRARLLRRVPRRRAPREPPPGPARLLRRPHLRARGRAARAVLPRGLAGAGAPAAAGVPGPARQRRPPRVLSGRARRAGPSRRRRRRGRRRRSCRRK